MWQVDEIDHYYIIQEENFPYYVALKKDQGITLSDLKRPQRSSAKEGTLVRKEKNVEPLKLCFNRNPVAYTFQMEVLGKMFSTGLLMS